MMRKYLLFLMIFVSLFYLSQPALSLDYKCDSRPLSYGWVCKECDNLCSYTKGLDSFCKASDCPSGTVLVDCPPVKSLFTIGYILNCLNLNCGDAGVPSGNTCVQDSSLDSSCINVVSKTYGYTDNYGYSNILNPCGCYETQATMINQYTKKADNTPCTDKNGKASTCLNGACKVVSPPTPTQCPDGTLENACCNTPGTRCKNDGAGALACQNDPTCPLCTDTDGGKVAGTKGTCKDVSGGVCDWRKGGCTDTCASNGAVNEYYCPSASSACMPATMPCSSSDVCSYGACTSKPAYGMQNIKI